MSMWDDEINMIEIDDETYAKEKQLREERRARKVKNLNIRRKKIAKIIVIGGISLGVLFNGERILDGLKTVVNKVIEIDNEAFEKEVESHKNYVHDMTGRTTDEIMNGSVSHQELTDAYNSGYYAGVDKGKELRDVDKENDSYNEDKNLSQFVEVDPILRSDEERDTYKEGYKEGLTEGYTSAYTK